MGKVSVRLTAMGALLLFAAGASAQVWGSLISKKGSKCMTRRNAGGIMTVVGVGCLTDGRNQEVSLNVATGELTIFGQCLERRGPDLVLDACDKGPRQKWMFNLGTREITPQDDTKSCIGLAGNGGDWFQGGDQRIVLDSCHKGISQQWFVGRPMKGPVPPNKAADVIAPDLLRTLKGGEVIKGIDSYMEVR